MMKNFETRTYGKWILAGEHAVLRGCEALVFPLKSRDLHFKFSVQNRADLELTLNGSYGRELELLFRGVFEKALELKKISKSDIHGQVEITSNLPIGAGLGTSAALCVALTRWFQAAGFVVDAEKHEFARQLENLFHGESSGVDIAVVTEERGLIYAKNGRREFFQPQWSPSLYISYCGHRGMTYECVNQVKALWELEPQRAQKIDDQMRSSVELCLQALSEPQSTGFEKLKRAIEMAAGCFESWNLTQGALNQHLKQLMEMGAAAVKPTGSGGGGYVLSLWNSPVPNEIRDELIPCFDSK